MSARKYHRPLTPGELSALAAFAVRWGRHWKVALRSQWERGVYVDTPPDDAALLQGLRNSRGPTWLASYRGCAPGRVSSRGLK